MRDFIACFLVICIGLVAGTIGYAFNLGGPEGMILGGVATLLSIAVIKWADQ